MPYQLIRVYDAEQLSKHPPGYVKGDIVVCVCPHSGHIFGAEYTVNTVFQGAANCYYTTVLGSLSISFSGRYVLAPKTGKAAVDRALDKLYAI